MRQGEARALSLWVLRSCQNSTISGSKHTRQSMHESSMLSASSVRVACGTVVGSLIGRSAFRFSSLFGSFAPHLA